MATTAKTAPEFTAVGENVKYHVVGDVLTVEIDLSHRNDIGKPKTIRVATTNGNAQVVGTDTFIGINAYVYRTPK